jgi:hypothetical protein
MERSSALEEKILGRILLTSRKYGKTRGKTRQLVLTTFSQKKPEICAPRSFSTYTAGPWPTFGLGIIQTGQGRQGLC